MKQNVFVKVFDAVKKIPKGKVSTYGEIARFCGINNPRIVGFALHQNKTPIEIPCHRVVNRFGQPSLAFVFGGKNVQKQWLKNEGIVFDGDKVDLQKYMFYFKNEDWILFIFLIVCFAKFFV